MSQASTTNLTRVSRRQVDKFAERRAELASAALQTLAELGFAHTTLREIALNSDFSHGVLHYYFTDKVDLIMHCVRQYKETCVTRYDQIVTDSHSAEEIVSGFSTGLALTLEQDAKMHRLWYDLRNQSLFDLSFRDNVAEIDGSLERMIGRIVSTYASLSGDELAFSQRENYAILDGIFQQGLLRYLAGEDRALGDTKGAVERILPRLLVGFRGDPV